MEKIKEGEKEKVPGPKEFEFEVPYVDREKGHVEIKYGNKTYKWFLREDGKTVILISGDERELTHEVKEAMKRQVRAILKPELEKNLGTAE